MLYKLKQIWSRVANHAYIQEIFSVVGISKEHNSSKNFQSALIKKEIFEILLMLNFRSLGVRPTTLYHYCKRDEVISTLFVRQSKFMLVNLHKSHCKNSISIVLYRVISKGPLNGSFKSQEVLGENNV